MKKVISVMSSFMICMTLLTGCSGQTAAVSSSASPARDGLDLTPADDILTYDKIDSSKTTLKVAYIATLGSAYEQMLAKFKEKYPDIQIVTLDITGGDNKYHPYLDWFSNGDMPDIILCSALSGLTNNTQYFEDLTSYDCAKEYDSQTLLKSAVNGQIYFLPGPANLSGMIYNKELFQKYGWKVPTTIDELIALCKQITEDTNGTVAPLNLDAKYPNVLIGTLEAMTYSQTMAGPENYGWYQDYQNGEAEFTGHMEPLFNLAQQLIDAGVLNKESFTYSATTRNKEFKEGSIAMINNDFSFSTDTGKYGTLALPGKTADDAYIFEDNSFWTGIPKQDHSDSVKTAITEFLNFVSSEEGQKAFIGDQTMITSTKDKWMQESDISHSIETVVQKGQICPRDYYDLNGITDDVFYGTEKIWQEIVEMQAGTKTVATALADYDETVKKVLANSTSPSEETVGNAAENFTMLQTSCLLADMFKDTTQSDISLVMHGVAYRGNLMRIYAGNITPSLVSYLKPRSFDNNSTLVTAVMSGKQLKEALNDPYGADGSTANCVYAFSGLKAVYAPVNDIGSKVVSVTMADGSEISDDKSYKVSFWLGTVNEKYYDKTTVQATEGKFEDLFTAYLKTNPSIAPKDTDRITLNWK